MNSFEHMIDALGGLNPTIIKVPHRPVAAWLRLLNRKDCQLTRIVKHPSNLAVQSSIGDRSFGPGGGSLGRSRRSSSPERR